MAGKLEQLKQLGELKEQGILTEEEFRTQKRAVLGG
ncbi:SHOCT domain-containing protein [Streptomyces sp. PA03-1a]|nr:SHOCT domain-containing protein [Streptomyces sp. PA03-1a]